VGLSTAVKNYFDLNARRQQFYDNIKSSGPQRVREALVNTEVNVSAEDKMTTHQQIIMYLGIFAGVACSTWVTSIVSGKQIEITSTSIVSLASISGAAFVTYLCISALIALLIVPIVYGKLDPKSPGLVQFALFFQNGVAWPILLDGVVIIKNSAGI
jgi:hypothetical protein